MIKTLQLIWKAITVPQQDTVALWRKIAFLDGVSLRCRRCRPCKICIILNPRSKILIQSFPQNSWISIHSFPTRLLFLKIPDRRTVSVLHLERHIPKNTFCWNRAIFFSICSSEQLSANWDWKLSQISWFKDVQSLFWPWKTSWKTATFHGAHPQARSTPLRARAFDEEPQAIGDGFV